MPINKNRFSSDDLTYMTYTWIEGEIGEKDPLFKISWWNHWNLLDTTINNTNEAYNLRTIVKNYR